MSSGPWIPIPKTISSQLPKDRPFTRVEAFLSVAIDFDNETPATIKGYSDLWRWSRGKVSRFIDEVGLAVVYPESTNQKQNQRGQIVIQIPDRKRADNGQIKVIDLSVLGGIANRKGAEDEQKTSRSQSTTIKTNTKTKKNGKKTAVQKEAPPDGFVLFRDWWMYAFNAIEDCKYPFAAKDGAHISTMLETVEGDWKAIVCRACHYLADPERFPPGQAPSLGLLRSSLTKYHGNVTGKVDHFRTLKLIPAEGVLLEDWKPWEKTAIASTD